MNHFFALTGIMGASFLVGFSGAVMPGPLLVVTIAESTRRGVRAGPQIVFGHMLLELAMVVALVLGLGEVLKNGVVNAALGLVGGAIMCWMGYGMVAGARRATLEYGTPNTRALHPCLSGIVVSLANPYWTIWWVTIGLGYLAMGLRFGLWGVAAFFVGHILADLVWYSLVSTATAGGRRLMSQRGYRWLVALCGIFVLAFGIWFLGMGFRGLRTLGVPSVPIGQNNP